MSAPFRRAFLSGALAVPATAALPAPISADPIRDAGAVLADAMQARHGGRWLTIIDLDEGFALTRPCSPREDARAIVVRKKGGAL